jgi:hypothetical protein
MAHAARGGLLGIEPAEGQLQHVRAAERAVIGGDEVATDEPHGEIVRLTVTHENLANDHERDAAASGWAAVLSNLKSFIETGHALPQAPWEMSRR